MRRQNQQGPALLGVLAEPPALTVAAFDRLRQEGAWVLDCHAPEGFGGGHIPGALNVGLSAAFPTWAGSVLPSDVPYLLLLEQAHELWPVCWELLRIGYELPRGWLAGGMMAWRTAAKEVDMLPQWTVWELQEQLRKGKNLAVVDVRQPQEWTQGHIAEAHHLTGAQLPERLDEIPCDRPIATICGSGYRSSVAASFLRHHGYGHVYNVLGGMSAWQAADLPLVRENSE
jgi:hydroxyacylglutathione hydrolase